MLVVEQLDTAGGEGAPRLVRHEVRGDTLDLILGPPRPVFAGGYTPERFDVRVRRLPPGAYWLRYMADVGYDPEPHLVFERGVRVP